MNKKNIPKWIHHPLLIKILKSDIGIILSYWIFQGMLYMDKREVLSKILFDVIGTFIFISIGLPLIVSFILIHTINMFINGHYYAMKSHMNRGSIKPDVFIGYIEKIFDRIRKTNFLAGAAAYGSLSRNVFRPTSDIDLRVFPKKGVFNWLKAVVWVFSERARAFVHSFPLDIYAFDLDRIDSKMCSDEPPIIFKDTDDRLKRKYKEYVLFDMFFEEFKRKYK